MTEEGKIASPDDPAKETISQVEAELSPVLPAKSEKQIWPTPSTIPSPS